MKREANFQTYFSHWLKNVYKHTGAFELKQTSTSLPFSVVEKHQLDALLQVKNGTFVFKIPDVGYQNPWDCFCLSGERAFIVIKFKSCFVLIDPETWQLESRRSKRRSLTESRAKEISNLTVII